MTTGDFRDGDKKSTRYFDNHLMMTKMKIEEMYDAPEHVGRI